LPFDGSEQDWEIELADPARVHEMLALASGTVLDHEEKCALFLLLLASIERGEDGGMDFGEFIQPVASLIVSSPDIRAEMIHFWIDLGCAATDGTVARVLAASANQG